MKELKNVLNEIVPRFYRFQVFIKKENGDKKTIGVAYLREGQDMYRIRLWTFLNEKYFLIPDKVDPKKYLVMTRESNKSMNSRSKFYWNLVGHGKANAAPNVLELSFDLLGKEVFVNIFPDESSNPRGHRPPGGQELAA
jgi:hypothetical protein